MPSEEYGVLMGRTGCGKTSVVEAICGLRPLVAGKIVLHDVDVSRLRPAERGIGYVPQDGALFDTMTVADHLRFALRIRRWSKNQIDRRVAFVAETLELLDLLDRFPINLSGGERQRVALGRALSFEPLVLVMDEPLSALDEETRLHMYEVLKRVHKAGGITVLHVTHSSVEANELGDLVMTFNHGKVERREPVIK